MANNTLKRSLIIGIIFLSLSTICLPVLASEGKPDLFIEDIFPYYRDTPPYSDMACMVVNIGNATAYGSINVHATVTWMFLRRFPIKQVREFNYSEDFHIGLHTGVRYAFRFADIHEIPKFGCYRFDCTVNPNHNIEESNYNNNDCTVTWFITNREGWFGGWHWQNSFM